MSAWSPEEDDILIRAILSGLSSSECGRSIGRSKGACVRRAHRKGWCFGVGLAPARAEMVKEYERGRVRKRAGAAERSSAQFWDDKLFEPYAVFKKRKAAERAKQGAPAQ